MRQVGSEKMRKVLKRICVAFIFSGLAFAGPAYADKIIQVAVSIIPQKYFVEKIGGERVNVSAMVLPGADPHNYEPKPQQMVALTGSDIYFAIGVPFENVWLQKFIAANPRMVVVHTEAGIQKIPMAHESFHGPAGENPHGGEALHEHAHDGLDPHIWLSPPLVSLQARHILDALVKADPEGRSYFEANYKKFITELVDLDLALMQVFYGKEASPEFMVFHPAWGYFANAYGLKQIPIEVEGKEPKAADLKRLIEYAQAQKVKTIFVQPQYSDAIARTIAASIGATVVPADPLAPDWAANLLQMGEKFKAALK